MIRHRDFAWVARAAKFILSVGGIFLGMSHPLAAGETPLPALGTAGLQIRITVIDAEEKLPLELAHVVLRRGGKFVAEDATNPAGQMRFHDIEAGTYTITVWFVGYRTYTDSIHIDAQHTVFELPLYGEGTTTQEVEVLADRELAISHIDVRSGNQVFESETYHVPPTARMTTLIQENVMGAARAPTGEVHIRGQHGEFTYYVDGLPVPLGVFGGLNEVVDPAVIERATFITGGFPAEYGGQMSAVIDLNNRVPTGAFHVDASTYAGSYLVFNGTKPFSPGKEVQSGPSSAVPADTLGGRVGPFRALNSNGQSLSVSDHIGKLGFYVSGSRQETDRRIDTPVPRLYHDHGFDYFLYGKFDYILSNIDYITCNLNFGRTFTQVPFDPSQPLASDLQETSNSFQAVSYFRALSSEIDQESNLFIGGYARQGGLQYTPGDIDPPTFQFADYPGRNYLLAEDRIFNTVGVRSTYDFRFSHEFMYKSGVNYSSTVGRENFTSRDSLNISGPSIVTDFTGSDFGFFAETEWQPVDWTSFNIGIRYDQHIAPDVPLQRQVSPRIRWNFVLDALSSAYIYYGRLFMPTNIEGLRSIARNVSNSVTPTVAERDDFLEAVYTNSFPFGLRVKLAAFHKHAAPFTDDATLGSSAIKTPFNIASVNTNGLELAMSYSGPWTPFSGYVNSSVIHAVGTGALTGGFLPLGSDGPATDLDHDQRLSVAIGLNYQPMDWFLNLEAIYGSGLSNGYPGNVPVYKTGLFDFNTLAHTSPSTIVNLGAGHTYHLSGETTIDPSVYITNLLDHSHLLKGAYTTGASWEERRNVVFKLSVHI
jgi:TonB dependent receptor/Carboxypeptidase regulatory-like domain